HPGADHSRLRRARARAARAARYARPPRYAGSDTVSDALLLMALLAAATARGAAPLVLAALGGLFAERSGIVDIGLEGKMLAAAFAAAATAAVTGLGLIYRRVLSGHTLLVYIAAVAVPAVAWLVYRTRFGLRLRAVGESPGAIDTAGISVSRVRYRALSVSGVLCGLSGAYL